MIDIDDLIVTDPAIIVGYVRMWWWQNPRRILTAIAIAYGIELMALSVHGVLRKTAHFRARGGRVRVEALRRWVEKQNG